MAHKWRNADTLDFVYVLSFWKQLGFCTVQQLYEQSRPYSHHLVLVIMGSFKCSLINFVTG